jgi:histidine phosphotransferase ChpT
MASSTVDLRIVELLAARLCHELVGAIGAISNGIELLDDEPDFAPDAHALIADSARQAARRLQFYRIAYGSTDIIAEELTRAAVTDLLRTSKIRVRWPEAPLPDAWRKLACNLLLLASEALTRGGEIRLDIDGPGLTIVAAGDGIRLTGLEPGLLAGTVAAADLEPRTVQPVFTALLARRLGMSLRLQESAVDQIVLVARS